MCWLRNILADKYNAGEDMDNMGNGNGEGKGHPGTNWYLTAGMLVFSITLTLKHTIGLHEFFMGFGQGFAIVLMIIGTFALSGKSVCRMIKRRKKLPSDNMQ